MELLGYKLEHLHDDYYDASDLNWHESLSKIVDACEKEGFEIVQMGGMKSCYSLILKKVKSCPGKIIK